MIFRLGLIKVKLRKFLDLEQLSKGHKQIVLPQLPIFQENLSIPRKRAGIGGLSFRLQSAIQFSLENSSRTACFSDDSISLNTTKFHVDVKRRFLALRRHGESSIEFSAGQ